MTVDARLVALDGAAPCEWYPVVDRDRRMPRVDRGAYCLKPAVVGSWPPRCGGHVGLVTGDDYLEGIAPG